MNLLPQPYQLCSPVATDSFSLTTVNLRRPTWEDRKSIRQIIRAETKRTGRRPCLLTVERTIVSVLSGLTMQQVRRIAPIDLAYLNAKTRAALSGKGFSS